MSKKPGILGKFFGGLWKGLSITRSIVLNLIFLFIVLVVVGALLSGPAVTVRDGSALVLNPQGAIVEQRSYIDPFSGLMGLPVTSTAASETLLRDILDAIDTAAADPAIAALVLRLDDLAPGGFSKLREIGDALTRFRESGKKIYAIGDTYAQHQYFLAAHADEVIVHPLGGVELEGLGSYQPYFSAALDKLDINMHIFRVGEYKAAVEPFLRDDMSAEARENNSAWLQDLWDLYLADVSRLRAVSPDSLQAYINEMDRRLAAHQGNAAQLALESGLVDSVRDRVAVHRQLLTEIGMADDSGDYKRIDYRDYLSARRNGPTLNRQDNVGVIVASGNIYDGEQRPGNIGGDTLAALIRHAAAEPTIKAVVLRLDTGGGSAFASEVIRNELQALKAAGKPVVVSMSSVAASGGYWIATAADQIWADPATLTGSIGIFALYPTFEETLDNLGIQVDGIGTTDLAGAWTPGNPLSPLAANIVQETLEHGYDRFLTLVAEGRDMSIEEVEAIAEGRVWSGGQARQLGLVDDLGNLRQAVAAAADLAGVDDYGTHYIERRLSPAEQLLMDLGRGLSFLNPSVEAGQSLSGSLLGFYRQLDREVGDLVRFNDPRGLYLHCLECRTDSL